MNDLAIKLLKLTDVSKFSNELNNIKKSLHTFDNESLYYLMQKTKKISNSFEKELFYDLIYKDSEKRYKLYIEKCMRLIKPSSFEMGSSSDSNIIYCGESPKHKVSLKSFYISAMPITEQVYSIFSKNNNSSDYPQTNISWFDAYIFCKWIGCRLPTEAEWEFASNKKTYSHWCCKENELSKYAWYSENSDGVIHEVGKKTPNYFGLYDMHGNIWEWVEDDYDENFYSKSELINPICKTFSNLKVCRGGSIHAFSEMCRSEFRYYEPANYFANDLGFRIAKDIA